MPVLNRAPVPRDEYKYWLLMRRPADLPGPCPNRQGWGYIHRAQRTPAEVCDMATITEQLDAYRNALEEARNRGDQATTRKLEQQISELEEFRQRHPEVSEAPSPLEVFCDLNPSNVNCLVYDD